MARTFDGSIQDVQSSARIVLRTEWEKLDVVMYPIYNDVYLNMVKEKLELLLIEDAMVIQHRAVCLQSTSSLWVYHKRSFFFISPWC